MRFIRHFANSKVTLLYTSDREDALSYSTIPNQIAVVVRPNGKVDTHLSSYCSHVICNNCPLDTPNFTGLNVCCSSAAQYLLQKYPPKYSKTKALHG